MAALSSPHGAECSQVEKAAAVVEAKEDAREAVVVAAVREAMGVAVGMHRCTPPES